MRIEKFKEDVEIREGKFYNSERSKHLKKI